MQLTHSRDSGTPGGAGRCATGLPVAVQSRYARSRFRRRQSAQTLDTAASGVVSQQDATTTSIDRPTSGCRVGMHPVGPPIAPSRAPRRDVGPDRIAPCDKLLAQLAAMVVLTSATCPHVRPDAVLDGCSPLGIHPARTFCASITVPRGAHTALARPAEAQRQQGVGVTSPTRRTRSSRGSRRGSNPMARRTENHTSWDGLERTPGRG